MDWVLATVIFAGITGLLGAADSWKSDEQAYNELESQKTHLKTSYENSLAEAGLEFNKAKEEAGRNAEQTKQQADIKDKETDISEKVISNDFNAAIDNLYLSQKSDALSWNNAAAQAGSGTGSALASIAGSGIRAGSSLSDAVMLESAANSEQLNFTQEAKRRSDSNNLSSVLYGLAGNKSGIYENRYGADLARNNADYLINSFLMGGSNYNIYQQNLKTIGDNYLSRKDALLYEQEKHSNYDRNGNWTGNRTWNAAASFLNMGAAGAKTAYGLYNVGKDEGWWSGNSNYTVTVGGK